MVRVNGRALEDYKRFEVRETGLAVPKAEPLYVPAVSNGYHPDDLIIDSSLVLYLPLDLLKGSKFKSVDRYSHTSAVTGALWRPNGRYFDGSDDFIDCGRSTAFDFGTGDFTLIATVNLTDVTEHRLLIMKGAVGVGNKRYWLRIKRTSGYLTINFDDNTNEDSQDGDTDLSDGLWHTVGVTNDRDGNVTLYLEGAIEGTPEASVATLSLDDTSKDLCVGVSSSDETSENFKGFMGVALMYSRCLTTAEMLHTHNVLVGRCQ